MRLLLIEDEVELADALVAALARQGVIVDHANDGGEGVEAARFRHHDVIILDRHLPDGDGLALIPALRAAAPGVPVIVLTALSEPAARIEGLDRGADDYLGKPFHVEELMARIRAILRRPAVLADESLRLGRLDFDPARLQASVAGAAVDLPRRELLILSALIRGAGKTVRRSVLEEAVYGFDDEIQSNALDANISRLRRKLSDARAGVEIHNVRGVGYLLKAEANG